MSERDLTGWPEPLTPQELRGAIAAVRAQDQGSPRALTLALIAVTLLLGAAPLLALWSGEPWTLALGLPGGLGAIMGAILLHECAHLSLPLPKRLQRALGALLGCWWLSPYSAYRRGHLAHHHWAGSTEGHDPTPSPQGPYAPNRALDLIVWLRVIPAFYWGGVWAPYLIYALRPTAHPRRLAHVMTWLCEISLTAAMLIIAPLLLSAEPWRFWLAWAVSFWLGSLAYEHLFTMHQHLGLEAGPGKRARYTLLEQINFARSTRLPLSTLFYHFNLHKEHHIAPSLPYHQLPKLHQQLLQRRPDLYTFTDDVPLASTRRARRAHEQLSPHRGDGWGGGGTSSAIQLHAHHNQPTQHTNSDEDTPTSA